MKTLNTVEVESVNGGAIINPITVGLAVKAAKAVGVVAVAVTTAAATYGAYRLTKKLLK